MKENIPGCPGYHVTRNGKVYSNKLVAWVRKSSFYTKSRNGRNCGYEYVVLHVDGRQKGFGVHKLVAMAYIPNPNNYPIVMHLDNNPLNNHIDNLQWGTHSMNNLQCSREGRGIQYRLKGKLNPMYGVKGNLHPSYGKPGAMKGKVSSMKGKVHTELTKTKISESLKKLHRTKLTERKKRRIMRLRKMNKSQAYIASRVNLHQTAISKFLKGGLG